MLGAFAVRMKSRKEYKRTSLILVLRPPASFSFRLGPTLQSCMVYGTIAVCLERRHNQPWSFKRCQAL